MRNFLKIVVLVCLIFLIRDFLMSESLLGESQADLESGARRLMNDFKEKFSWKKLTSFVAVEGPPATTTTLPRPAKLTDIQMQDLKSGLKSISDGWQDPKQEIETRIPVQSLFQNPSVKCQRTYTQFRIRTAEDLGGHHGLEAAPEPGQVFMKAQAKETCAAVPERSYDLQLHFDCRGSDAFFRSKNLKDCKPIFQFLSQRVSCVASSKDKLDIQWGFEPNLKLQMATEVSGVPTLSARTRLGQVTSGPCAGRLLYQRNWVYQAESGSIRYLVSARSDDLIVLGQWMQDVPKAYELFSSFQATTSKQDLENWFGLSPAQRLRLVEGVGRKEKPIVFMDLSTEIAPELNPPEMLDFNGQLLKISKTFINDQNDFPAILQKFKKVGEKDSFEILQMNDEPGKFLVKDKSFFYGAQATDGPTN